MFFLYQRPPFLGGRVGARRGLQHREGGAIVVILQALSIAPPPGHPEIGL